MAPIQTRSHAITFSTPIPTAAPPAPSQPGVQPGWGPAAISGLVFGLVMLFIGVATLYQGSQHARRRQGADDEVGSEHYVEEHVPTSAGLQGEWGTAEIELQQCLCQEREVAVEGDRLHTEGETGCGFVPKGLVGTRTDTDETLTMPEDEGVERKATRM
ncbi:MAG: hypothetical protein Q9187_001825 [Circinaria calcarea]